MYCVSRCAAERNVREPEERFLELLQTWSRPARFRSETLGLVIYAQPQQKSRETRSPLVKAISHQLVHVQPRREAVGRSRTFSPVGSHVNSVLSSAGLSPPSRFSQPWYHASRAASGRKWQLHGSSNTAGQHRNRCRFGCIPPPPYHTFCPIRTDRQNRRIGGGD
jgi:hypothetical protein